MGVEQGELLMAGDAHPAFRLSEKHYAAVRRDPSAVKGGAHLLPGNRWQVEGERDILVHNSLPLLECAASARGIMPHIQFSDYIWLIACVTR